MSRVTQPAQLSAPAAQHWQQVKAVLAQALDLAPETRRAFVQEACGTDGALRNEVLALLQAEQAARTAALEEPPMAALLEALQERTSGAWIGQRLGPYQITSLVARGGMGEVYRAERADGQYEQQVAVKLMHHGAGPADALARFKSERQILASLDHPNLAKVLDGGITDHGVPYFVMEFVAGLPIDRYCDDLKLSTRARLQLFRTVCQVVHYAHLKGVVHRDLKAANILVTHEGTVKLVDFGIAKRLGPTGVSADTATALRAMTLPFASPEQVRGADITPSSDIYSLGVVLYRLLTGASPYPADAASDYDLAWAICHLEPVRPSRAPATPGGMHARVPADLDAVVLMALRKDPTRRYLSAEKFADDVFRHLEHLPVQARRGAWGYAASRFLLRHRMAVGAAALANLALLVGLGVAAHQTIEANRQRELAQHHLRDTRQLANVLILDVYDAIRNLPGSTAARQLVVRNALSYLRRAAGESGDDASQRLEIAKGFRNVGDLQGHYGYANLGDYPGALESYETALNLLSAPGHPRPADGADDPAVQEEMAQLYQRKGSLLSRLGRQGQADAALREGLVLGTALASRQPDNLQAQSDLATLHGVRSDVLMLQGDLSASVAERNAAIRLLETVSARAPDNKDAGLSLASGYLRRGDSLLRGTPNALSDEQALEEFRRALQVLQRLARHHSDYTPLARSTAIADLRIGNTMLRLGRPAEAEQHHRQAVQVLTRLVDADPLDHQFRGDIVKSYIQLSTSLDALGDLPGSVAAARAATTHGEQLPDSALANVVIRFHKGEALYSLGRALERQATQAPPTKIKTTATQKQDACARYRESLPLILSSWKQVAGARLAPETVQAALQRCEKS